MCLVVVYDIKCILDDVLNITENATDAVLNALGPLIDSLLGKASDVLCMNQIKVLGLCL